MDKNIVIANPKKLKQIKKEIYKGGVDNIYIITDFDKTLTCAFVDGEKRPSLISVLRDGDYLSPDYAEKAHTLYNKYHSIEIDLDISTQEKKKAMHEWWKKHYDLLVKSGMQKKHINEVVLSNKIKLRAGTGDFFNLLHEINIPLIIMSASGLGDGGIKFYLQQEKKLYNNIHIISNLLEFDERGYFIKAKEPIIHSMNKDGETVRDFPVYAKIKNRKNVVLLGDSLSDINMVHGLDYKNLIKIGFLNDKIEENIEAFKNNYDIIILDDGPMNYVNDLLRELVN